jgi:NO-binding membrane sensor protein with MHYT domain
LARRETPEFRSIDNKGWDVTAVSAMQMNSGEGGVFTPAIAYIMSCTGSALSLSAMTRARSTDGKERIRWMALSAVALGGTGIWVMHFIAMLGFSVSGVQITYAVPATIASLVLAIVIVGIGLAIAVYGRATPRALVIGGVVTGLGVAGMHYLGMSAVRMAAHVSYNPLIVIVSVLIAVVAATAALWAAMNIRGAMATLGASLVMGLAVSGMHYSGMAAMEMSPGPTPTSLGLTANQLVTPLVVGIGLTTVVMLFIVGLGPTERELREQDGIQASLRKLAEQRNQR